MAIRLNGVNHESTLNEKSTIPHGVYHMMANPETYEIQRTNDFEFVCTDISNLIRPGTDTQIASGYSNLEVLRLSVLKAFVPHFSLEPVKIQRGNGEIKFAGKPSFKSGSISLYDYIGAETKAIIMAWQGLSYNVYTEKVGLVTDYKKTCYLIEYTPDHLKVRQYILYGCWVTGIDEDEYNADSNNAHSIRVTIEYDRAVLDPSDTPDEQYID